MIPVTLVLKYRLYPVNNQSDLIKQLMKNYSDACNYASRADFRCKSYLGVTALHKKVYYPIRAEFNLKAQEADSVPKTVKARYQSVNTQLRRTSCKQYKDVYTKKYFYINKTVNDIWHPINFRTPQADLVYKNDWRIISHQHALSINTTTGHHRIIVKAYLPKYFKKYLKVSHKLGTAKLLHKRSHFYLHASCTIFVKSMKQLIKLIGSDRGLRFLCCPFDGHKFVAVKGLSIRKKRTHFLHRRAILQHKHTESAKRKLKQMSGQENCWMTTLNHAITKALVAHNYNVAYVLENLRGVRFANIDVKRKYRYGQVSWAFYQFGQFLAYKAKLHQSKLIHVPKQYTSQRCPKCGYVCADNRNHGEHKFVCQNLLCHYQGNDDFTASKNIRFLGILTEAGYSHPAIQDNSLIAYRKYYSHQKKYKIKHLEPRQAIDLATAEASHVTNR